MVSAKEVPADKLIAKLAERLKKSQKIEPPSWAMYAKTGVFKEKPPVEQDWWYIRAASLLRKISLADEPLGVGTLRTMYGGKKRNGNRPPHFRKGSGSIIRTILQQLEQAGFIVTISGKGRKLSPSGQSLVDNVAKEILKEISQ
ncbi:ribosomal protein S19E (S16A) [Caldisphaera lagunensis DSM 15908]|uniref:Small ribosomal subunit protein eS19 n=1 Tax=Caldisphaera lagunensis (strain DSM 15908 / JCM 11604 / ANMR 0165 / IC-154) TaxID=1056495 RepID=L0ACM8_CALLD|nr:30S ribosomal protein S19e [Caldisphaera lagunensis]AFZ70902.1 ribosomal protein S19E (S16A) [Caldisphaera lagunensis DSM 15908]